MPVRTPLPVWLLAPLMALQACSGDSGGGAAAPVAVAPVAGAPASVPAAVTPGATRTASLNIAQIAVSGAPFKVFDHTRDQQSPDNVPDAQITAWREADGTVDLMIPDSEGYRMRGADLLHLSIDPSKIYSSIASADQTAEDPYNYSHWFMGPYSVDGVHFYTLTHSEWYACLLHGNCAQPAAGGGSAQEYSWANTVNSFVSADGGATWKLNVVNGNHAVANTSFHWTGSMPLAQNVYLQALNHSGMFQPTRLVQEGSYWYTVVFYIHRDFSQINPSAGVYEAPIDKTGYVLLRTSDFTDPNSWQAWNGGSDYEPIANETFQTFDPKQGSTTLNAAPPQLLYDATAHVYVLMHTLYGGSNAVYYMSTASLSTPVWSDSTPIVGTARMVSDPGGPLQGGTGSYGPVTGFNDSNYPSMIDAQSPGYNFEFISGGLYLFYSTSPGTQGGDTLARDVYRVPLAVTYQ